MNEPFWFFLTDNNEELNYLYSIIGKILMISTRFETYCKNLNLILSIKTKIIKKKLKLDNIYLNKLSNKIYSLRLFDNINNIFGKKEYYLKKILINAKNIRNEIVHEITKGLDNPNFNYDSIHKIIKKLKNKAKKMIEAELILIYIIAILTDDIYPNNNYINDVLNWIFYK